MENTSLSRKSFFKALKKRKTSGDYDQMIVAAKNAISCFPGNKRFKRLLHYAQAHYVNQKLNSSIVKDLKEHKDYNSLSKIYLTLLTVFPESKHLKKLLSDIKNKIETADKIEHANFFHDAKKNIKIFIIQNRFDEAEQACYQILSYDPQNAVFKKLLKQIQRKNKKEINEKLEKYFITAIPELKKEFLSDKKSFIRV